MHSSSSFSSSSTASATADLIDVEVTEGNPVALVRLNRAPVNSMSLEFISELTSHIEALEKEKSVRGFILASARPGVYSAGLDINEMWRPDPVRLASFWDALQGLFITLYGSRLASVAAIEGNSPAGGCLMAMCCEARVMAQGDPDSGKPYSIGLNETKLGIVAPFWFVDAFLNTVNSPRTAELMLMRGDLISADEAVKVQLVDRVESRDDVMSAAEEEMKHLLSVPDKARYASKMRIRGPVIDRLVEGRADDAAEFLAFSQSEPVQRDLTRYMEALKARAAAKKK